MSHVLENIKFILNIYCRLREQMKNNYEIDVNHRREYVKTFSSGGSECNKIIKENQLVLNFLLHFSGRRFRTTWKHSSRLHPTFCCNSFSTQHTAFRLQRHRATQDYRKMLEFCIGTTYQ